MYSKDTLFSPKGKTVRFGALLSFGAMLAAIALFSSCGKSPTDSGVDTSIGRTGKKVLSTLSIGEPRLFDAQGMLNGTSSPMELWMGVGNPSGGVLVGYVTFVNGVAGQAGKLIIDFSDGGDPGSEPDLYPFIASEIHIDFADNWGDIPGALKNGGLIPGKFDYTILPKYLNQTRFEIDLPTPDSSIETFLKYGAIHAAGVVYGGLDGFDYWLPDGPVTITVTRLSSPIELGDTPVVPSYMEFDINDDNGDFIDGSYEGWCVDTDHAISKGVEYEAIVYSSYDQDVATLMLVDKPFNLGAVNYLINWVSVGKKLDYTWNGTDYSRLIRFGDIQLAVWYLIDNTAIGTVPPNSGLGRVSLSAAQYLAQEALKHTDFVPMCGQKIAFIVQPTLDGIPAQIVLGTLSAPCETASGTVWADGKDGFTTSTSSWATIFGLSEPTP